MDRIRRFGTGQAGTILSLLGQSGPRRFLMQGQACRKIVADVAAKRQPGDDLGVAANRRTYGVVLFHDLRMSLDCSLNSTTSSYGLDP